ncbi:class I SAM-dependent methyltransferase [Magnetospirillum gryphiswaldense]|uniref:Uncharacterized protein n=2 Tax=Magnetospirillum gryphiswaldense TaxID=55518 RepID=A4U2W0_9PROT|nr:class I SAM-dependent methyltransferase [Magnetospirillum gryphiswaldense]AVM75631.1 Methyltransferase domain protein [Magnetospirillum gryphiswaldense MSR-1]AVM79534.1 Methyltransferase domain protein [Magnetospirillum gryphiswaldense]CAM77217.1 conserved hypothetical protein [Magnetospirillum gryphiswaldense MSR-1]
MTHVDSPANCPVCGALAAELYRPRWVHRTSGYKRFIESMQAESTVPLEPEPFHYCDTCGFLFHPERPSPPTTPVFKAMSEGEVEMCMDQHIDERNQPRFQRRNEWVKTYLKPGLKALDVGSEYGLFVKFMSDCGCEVTGIEPHAGKLQAGRRRWGLDLIEGYYTADSFPPESFDIITAEAVAYYFRPFPVFMEQARKHLKPRGLLYIQMHTPAQAPMHWFASFIRCLVPHQNAHSVFGRLGWDVVAINSDDYQRGSAAFILRLAEPSQSPPGMSRAEALRCLTCADFNLLPRRGLRPFALTLGLVQAAAALSPALGAGVAKIINRSYRAFAEPDCFE